MLTGKVLLETFLSFVCLFVCLLSPLFAHLLQGIGLPPGRKRYILLTGNRLFANCFQLDHSVSFCVFPVKIKICCLFSFAR